MAAQFAKLKNKYTSKGYPVIIGEYAGLQRMMPSDQNQEKHDASVKLYYKRVNEYATNNGLVAFAWDTNAVADLKKESGSSSIIDRSNCQIVGTNAMEGIKEGLSAGTWPFATGIQTYRATKNDSKHIHTLMGIPVTEGYRGIVIDNGKKISGK